MRGAYVFDKNFYNSDIIKSSQNNVRSVVGEAEWNFDFSSKHTIRAGINATSDHSQNTNYSENHERNRFSFFVNDAFSTDFITLTANIRQEWLEKRQPTTFALGFEKKILKSQKAKFILRGAISRNFNMPTFNDLYWAELGNPFLETEQGWSKELGASVSHKKEQRQWQAHLTFFDIDMKNRIVWQPQTDGKWRPTNINRIVSRGIETWANYRGGNARFQYKISANYQLAHATDGNGGVQLFVPKHNGSVSAWVKFRSIYATWQQTASSKRYGTTDKTTWTNSFTLADATLGYTPSVWTIREGKWGLKTDLRLRIDNIFNTDYQVIRYYPTAKRSFRAEVILGF